MNPKTKKTLIIVLAVVIIAVIIYFAFFRKAPQEFEQVIAKLPVSDATKRILRKAVRNTTSDPNWSAEGSRQAAEAEGYDYAMWVVMMSAARPEYINSIPSTDYEALMRVISEQKTVANLTQKYL